MRYKNLELRVMITKINKIMRVETMMLGVFSFLISFSSFLLSSCSDMLENDSSRQVFDPKLDQKTDSVYYALGILQGMQELADHYVFQGEMRGDLVQTTSYTDNNLRQLANFSATTTNKYDSAYVYYRVINNCNYYIAHRDTTLRTGAEYVAMKEYVAVKAIRAWAYMQLARVYGKVPFYTEPLTQISQIDNNDYPELDMAGIVARLAPDLEQYSGYETPTFGGTVPANSVFFPSAIFMPVDVVLGDMYLETEQFEKAALHYITYLTLPERSTAPSLAYTEPYSFGSRRNGAIDEMPSDWDVQQNSSVSGNRWSTIFSTSVNTLAGDVLTYIPMAQTKQQGATTNIPKSFGFDFYANNKGYIDEIQILPSESYVALSKSQDYYYISTLGTSSSPIVNAAELGDTRLSACIHEDEDAETDSVTTWITKFNNARILIYRNTTVYMHLAEALNRLGLYDAAFAILKDGINEDLIQTYVDSETGQEKPSVPYMRMETIKALKETFPILSLANISKFSTGTSSSPYRVGVHCHGTGYANSAIGNQYSPSLSPYQFDTVVPQKMQEIAETYNVTVGSSEQDIINAVEDLLCDEYALEFAFEGARFYDLCRLARHKNASSPYGANFGGQWLAKKLAYKNPVKDLTNESNWYLPFK